MKNYSNREIKWLVEEREAIESAKGTHSDYAISLICKSADFSIALTRMSKVEREAVLLCGMLELSTRTAGKLVGVSKDTMNRRYKRGLISLARYLNNAV